MRRWSTVCFRRSQRDVMTEQFRGKVGYWATAPEFVGPNEGPLRVVGTPIAADASVRFKSTDMKDERALAYSAQPAITPTPAACE